MNLHISKIAHVIHFWCQILFFDVNQTIYVTKLFHTSRGFDTLGSLQTAWQYDRVDEKWYLTTELQNKCLTYEMPMMYDFYSHT